MRKRSLRLRLFLAATVSVTTALALAFVGLSALFSSHVERRAIDELSVQLDQVLAGVERNAAREIVVGMAPADTRFSKPFGGLYWQIEAEGRQLRSRSLWDFALDLPPDRLKDGAVHVHYLPGPGKSRLLVMERNVQLPARLGGSDMRAAVAMDAARLEESVREFREDLLPYTGMLAVFLILAGALQIFVGLRPLNAIEKQVARVRSGELNRVGEDFPSEILPLATEVDALLKQRETDIERARHRAGDLAHGLKTPLQALLGEANRLRETGDPSRADAIEQVADSMQRHVDRELARVRVSAHATVPRSDLAKEVGRVAAVVQRAGRQAELDWQTEIPFGIFVSAAAEDLSEIFGALLENASRHARSRVYINAAVAGDHVTVDIGDDGPGIAPEKLASLTRRGVRADESGAGAGLGLAIAGEVAEALGGTLQLQSASPGLLARVSLPLSSI